MKYIFKFKKLFTRKIKKIMSPLYCNKITYFVLNGNIYSISINFKFSKIASIQETSRDITNCCIVISNN